MYYFNMNKGKNAPEWPHLLICWKTRQDIVYLSNPARFQCSVVYIYPMTVFEVNYVGIKLAWCFTELDCLGPLQIKQEKLNISTH